MPERTLPADHKCTVIEFNTAVGIWRCACGRAYRLPTFELRAPEHDYNPLPIEGDQSDGGDDAQ